MNELATIPQNGPELFRLSTDAAGLCKEIVVRTAKTIQGRKFVPVEGWQAIAVAHGCVASAGAVERVEGGFRAIGVIKRMDNGQEISTAEGFVGDDEPMWAKRPEFARRAMAQTRAISRACRSAFAHVVVMMNAGLQTTPAEEMDHVVIDQEPEKKQRKEKAVESQEESQAVLKAAPEQIDAIHTALSECNVPMIDLLKKAELVDLADMPADDVAKAIQWIRKQAKK